MPLLTNGVATNYAQWKESMRGEIAIEYGLLASILDTGEIWDPPEVDPADFELDNDPHGIEALKLRTAVISRQKQISAYEVDLPKVRAKMWKYMSRESQEAVLGHEDYDDEAHRNDPLQLALSIEATHQGGGANNNETRKPNARITYRSTRQGPTKSIAEYKNTFSFLKKAYL